MRQESRKTRSVERDLPSNSKKLQVAQKKKKKNSPENCKTQTGS